MTIQDTSLLDVITFAEDNHCEYLMQRAKPLIASANIDIAIACGTLDSERDDETFNRTCKEFSIEAVLLERMEPAMRIESAKKAIDSHFGL